MDRIHFLNHNRQNCLRAFSSIVAMVANLAGVTALAGCGSTPTSALSSTVTGLTPGLYSGTLQCVGINLDGTTTSFAGLRGITVGKSGLPDTENGDEVASGVTRMFDFGPFSITYTITRVTQYPNGVIVDSEGIMTIEVSCNDTCLYPGDGECDDGGPGATTALCVLGTDCTDCGRLRDIPVIGNQSYKSLSLDQIEYRETSLWSFGDVVGGGDCHGVLTR